MSVNLFETTAERTGPLGRLNAGVKLLGTLLLTLGLLLVKDWVAAGMILVLELVAIAACRINPLRLLGTFWPVLLGALLSGWSTALLAEKTSTELIHAGPIWVSTGSLAVGGALMLRGLGLALPGLLLIATTDPTDIADSLAQTAKLPARFVLAALASLRLVEILLAEWRALGQARRARGLGAQHNPLARVHTALGQSFALLVQAIRRGTRLATTMEARGFGTAERTWARVPTYARADAWFLCGCLAIVALGYLLAWVAGSLTFIWQ
ncbi:energy-coupling factor transporter transmembrane component T [Rothia sp. LK2588]|uniref:energy-coupling factor transporter transmembrane protein EcfT n=1 Tax=Rothia sp. LK2588 TaxID=3114369 RepID=UPI0034CF1335